MKPIRFHAAARRELREGFHYYDSKQPGLSNRWLNAVDAVSERLRTNPSIGHPLSGKVRKCRVADFPYDVLFESQKDAIRILAVMHHRRHPDYWKTRVDPA